MHVYGESRGILGKTYGRSNGSSRLLPPGRLDALVLDAALRQSLVAVRSLGRAGLVVGAASPTYAPAFDSRWSAVHARLADAARDERALADGIRELVGRWSPRVLLAAHDGTIETLRSLRPSLGATVALADEPALERAVDKQETYAAAGHLGIGLPRTAVVREPSDIAAALPEVGLPTVVKPARSWSPQRRRLQAVVAMSAADAARAAALVLEAGVPVLLQEWVGGAREAVSLVRAEGRVRQRFAQVAYRTAPPLGGASVVRESIPLPADATPAAEALVEALELDGYAEVEFRRDGSGRPLLMEVNPRLSASVEVAVRSGIDFPRWLYVWAAGGRVVSSNGYRVGVRMRWLGGDVHWLWRTLRTPGKPDSLPPLTAVGTFAGDFFRGSGYDYLVLSDLRPGLTACRQFVVGAARRARRELGHV